MDLVSEPSNKATMLILSILFEWRNRFYERGDASVQLLDSSIMSVNSGMTFRAFSQFYEEFNKKIGGLISNGLIYHWEKNYRRVHANFYDESGPKVLTLEHLSLGLYACLIPLVISSVLFLIEVSVPFMRKRFVVLGRSSSRA